MRKTRLRPVTWPFRCALAGLALGAGFALPGEAQIAWSEEFDAGAAPDPTVWSYDLGSHGWGNNELQEYTSDPGNVFVEDGSLFIRVAGKDGGSGFTSARIRTQDKLTFRYGTVEARIRIPDLANGLWPAFWTLGNSFGSTGWPASGEIDIMEMGHSDAIAAGTVNRRVGSAAHWENNESHAQLSAAIDAPAGLDDGFHLFRLDWTPGNLTTFLDGAPVWTMDISPRNCTDCSEFHEPHFLILNVAVGGDYPGIHSAAGVSAPLPAEMEVDYIRIFDNGFTEMGGSAVEGRAPDVGPGHSGSWVPVEPSAHGFSIDNWWHSAIQGMPILKLFGIPVDRPEFSMAR